jgi:hypothetical protein
VEGDVGLEVAIGIDLELVASGRIEAALERGRVGVDVHDKHRSIAAAGRLEDYRSVISVRGSGASR